MKTNYSRVNVSASRRVSRFRSLAAALVAVPLLGVALARADIILPAQLQKLIASDGTQNDAAGFAVALSGDIAVMGAYGQNDAQGAAYVRERNAGGTDVWGEVKKLTASDGAEFDEFGVSVAAAGDVVVVGANGQNAMQGAAYVYVRNAGGSNAWSEVKKLVASDGVAGDYFGVSVAVRDNVVVVGAGGRNGLQGAAYVYERNAGGPDAWGETKKLTASDGVAGDYFGGAVGVSGNGIVVASSQANVGAHVAQGAAYVYERDAGGPGAWGETNKLTAADGEGYDMFGVAVAIDGNTVVVGASGASAGTGASYVFERGAGAWGETKKLSASDGAPGDEFGISVGVDVDTVLVGAWGATVGMNVLQGAAYVYGRNLGGTNAWGEVGKLTASDGAANDRFGSAVSVAADVIVGAAWATIGTNAAQGAAYMYAPGLAPLSVTTAALTNGQVGVAYSQTLTATNGVTPYSWLLTAGTLPGGLTLSAAGVISGTPTNANTFSFTAQVQDALTNTATRALSITVDVAPLSITTAALPGGDTTRAYSQTLAASGGTEPYTWSLSAGALPDGLALSVAGVISGMPTAVGTFTFTAQVQDTNSAIATRLLTIVITLHPPLLCPPETNSAALSATGSYDGFFYNEQAFDATNVTAARGTFALKITKLTGRLTAKAVLQKSTISFSAKAWTSTEADGTMIANMATRGGESLDLHVQENRIWGTLTGGSLGGETLTLDGARNRFGDRKDTAAQALLNSYRGYYTVSLPADAALSLGSAESAPQGSGYVTVTIGSGGSAKIAGVLADGTKVSQSSRLVLFDGCGPAASVPLFAPLYSRKGWVGGLLWIDPATRTVITDREQGWFVRWEKPGTGVDGFSELLDSVGGFYSTTPTLAAHYLFSAQTNDVSYFFAGGEASNQVAALPNAINVTVSGTRMTMTKATRPTVANGVYDYSAENSAGATLSFASRTGIFKGKFNLYYDFTVGAQQRHQTVKVPYVGVLTPVRDAAFVGEPAGQGAYLVPDNDPQFRSLRLKRSFMIELDAVQ